jgi:signal transduction histidine kinase
MVITDMAAALAARRQRIDLAIAADAERVRADPAKLHDALRNLVANAITYAPEDSTIRISAQREGGRVTIAVADDGPGVPDEDLARVFERFYRVEKSRTRTLGGTGIGLTIARALVEAMHGAMRAESMGLGKGSTFTFTLPLAE